LAMLALFAVTRLYPIKLPHEEKVRGTGLGCWLPQERGLKDPKFI